METLKITSEIFLENGKVLIDVVFGDYRYSNQIVFDKFWKYCIVDGCDFYPEGCKVWKL